MSIFNRMHRANIVTSGLRNTSKACFVKNFQSQFSRQLRDWRNSHHTVSEAVIACFNRIIRTNIVTIASLLAVACKVTSQSPLRWHSSDHQHHAVDFFRSPMSSYFHSQGFNFYAIEFTHTAMNSHFRSLVRLSCDGKLTRNCSNSNFHPQSAIVIFAPIDEFRVARCP